MEVECRDVMTYGKLFFKKEGLVNLGWHPDLVNYRCNGDDFDVRYKERMAGYREKCAMDMLLREGSMLSKDLKQWLASAPMA